MSSYITLIGAAMLVVLLLWKLPKWQVPKQGLELRDRIDFEIKARGVIAQIVLGSLFLFTIFSTWRSLDLSRRTMEITERSAITNRFTAAIQLLGSTSSNDQATVPMRLGGIYALEQIARESDSDYWPVMEVLTGYLRHRAPANLSATFPAHQSPYEVAPDVEAIVNVIGRRQKYYQHGESHSINLRGVDLRGIVLLEAHLEGADLQRSNLSSTDFAFTRFNDAVLADSDLRGAILVGADLSGANLKGARILDVLYDKHTKWPAGIDPTKFGTHLVTAEQVLKSRS